MAHKNCYTKYCFYRYIAAMRLNSSMNSMFIDCLWRVDDGYMPQLDALRAIAVLIVAWWHWAPREWSFGLPLGAFGVQLFFVLSGFLITGILLSARNSICDGSNSRHGVLFAFYARRCLRIFPLYYAVIIIGYAAGLAHVRDSILWTATYTANVYLFSIQDWHMPIGHFWSLAVEEQFYLLWPGLILYVSLQRLRVVLIFLLISAVLFRIGTVALFSGMKMVEILPFNASDALAGGALLALLGSGSAQGLRYARYCLLIGVLVFSLTYGIMLAISKSSLVYEILRQMRITALVLVSVWLVASASKGFNGLAGRIMENRVLVWCGRISYGIYVLHIFSLVVLEGMVNNGWLPSGFGSYHPLRLMFLTAITVATAWVSWRFFESPLNELKRFFPYVRDRRKRPA